MGNIFFDIGLIFIVASIFSCIAKLFNQPKIPFYVLAGFVVGPLGLMIAEKVGLIIRKSKYGLTHKVIIVNSLDWQTLLVFLDCGIGAVEFRPHS